MRGTKCFGQDSFFKISCKLLAEVWGDCPKKGECETVFHQKYCYTFHLFFFRNSIHISELSHYHVCIKPFMLDTITWICLKRWKKIKKCMGFQHKILNTWHHQGLVERTSGVTVEAGLGVDLHVNGGS